MFCGLTEIEYLCSRYSISAALCFAVKPLPTLQVVFLWLQKPLAPLLADARKGETLLIKYAAYETQKTTRIDKVEDSPFSALRHRGTSTVEDS